ncbi:hypothetical protein J7F01_12590 [Streptomyces sp. ISL-22]|nr:hypothetical protein [Streptomyces sp. ISL-24]MBT2420367.1 hypothetical protein [Streptomyces sp. ISL-24]MBT2433019.1 hypothetical protein [Streptomyces sp. ISL-22]
MAALWVSTRAAITAWLAALTTLLPTSSGPRGSRSANTPPYSRKRMLVREWAPTTNPSEPTEPVASSTAKARAIGATPLPSRLAVVPMNR